MNTTACKRLFSLGCVLTPMALCCSTTLLWELLAEHPKIGGFGTPFQTGSDYSDTGDYEKAVLNFDESIRLNPKNASAYYKRGIAYQGLGEDERAERDFQKAKELGYVP